MSVERLFQLQQDAADYEQAASVEAGLRREFQAKLAEARKLLYLCRPALWDDPVLDYRVVEFLKRTE